MLRQASGAGGYTGVIDFVGNAASFKMVRDWARMKAGRRESSRAGGRG